jgi:phenylacetate-CoA ligase
MIVSESIRNKSFWLQDRIQGGFIKKHLTEISAILAHGGKSLPTGQLNQQLNRLLNNATKTTVFYKAFQGKTINYFPVINKSIIKDSYISFLSSDYNKNQLIPIVTSGSTGTPFKVYHDKNKRLRNTADTIYFAGQAGYEIGQRLIYLKIWAKQKMRSSFSYRLQNIMPADVLHLNDTQIESLIKSVENSSSTFCILGYASAFETICQYLDRKKSGVIKAKVTAIISMSETLNDFTKKSMQKYFNAPVVARYSNLENGIIAQQEADGGDRYLVNTASYFVEILKLGLDEPAEEGELGRIVVTDLFNYAMPLIRYDTGDLGAYETDADRPGLLFLSRVEGRRLDVLYDTKGEMVSSYLVYKNMWQYTEINQYQLIQEGEKDYTFKINTNDSFTKEEQLIKEFKSYLGTDAKFKISYVNEIPLLASGKRKKIVNNFRKELV